MLNATQTVIIVVAFFSQTFWQPPSHSYVSQNHQLCQGYYCPIANSGVCNIVPTETLKILLTSSQPSFFISMLAPQFLDNLSFKIIWLSCYSSRYKRFPGHFQRLIARKGNMKSFLFFFCFVSLGIYEGL